MGSLFFTPPNATVYFGARRYMDDLELKYKDVIKDLEGWVKINSVEGESAQDAPFGKAVKDALVYGLELGKRMGFEVINYDNYVGEIVWGDGEEIGIIGHADIVPAGDGWETDPFTLTLKDGKLFGRGTTDDKGPTLCALYAMKQLKDEGFVPKKKIRFILGCNEETDWGDVAHFNKVSKFPKYGFSPDGDFPVVFAEKGPNELIFRYDLGKDTTVKKFVGGTVVNAVCGKCTFVAKIDEELIKKHGLVLENGEIVSIGKTAHGSMPEKGKNAILPALGYLADVGENVQPLIDYLFDDKLGVQKVRSVAGNVTMSPDLVSLDGTAIVLNVDFRVPAEHTLEEMLGFIDRMGIPYTAIKKRDPLYVPKDDKFVQTLINAYNKATGENKEPVSQCGGTFASVFEKGCAFGPEFDGRSNNIHEPNEYLPLAELDLMIKIYKQAIKDLCE